MSLFLLENFNHMLGKHEQADLVSRITRSTMVELETVYVSKLPVVV